MTQQSDDKLLALYTQRTSGTTLHEVPIGGAQSPWGAASSMRRIDAVRVGHHGPPTIPAPFNERFFLDLAAGHSIEVIE